MRTNVSDGKTKENLYLVREHAVPEVLIKVAEANRLLESGKVDSVQDAAESVGISRSSYYKYKDDISLFHENSRGRTVNLVIQMDDERGMLSNVLKTISDSNVNILTIQQSVPVRGIASVILSLDMNQDSVDPDHLAGEIEELSGIHYVKILARE
ncbi:MAG: ACT domain-containing protein [Lachnospiraceae bacterium]|nr:ACT domain-containing protein [Lachnospiraceae bacterium]